jgi:hypothetical protein
VGGADGVVDVIQEIMSSVRWFQSERMDEWMKVMGNGGD